MTPDEYTIKETMLQVGEGHKIYVQQWGKKSVRNPIIFLHGGPGSGCSDSHKSYFNPTKQQVIFFDQRGCGKSLPYGDLEHNTTDKLVEDILKILDYFSIQKATFVGGSWGSALALYFGIKRPKMVKAMVLRGIFTARSSEINFLEQGGFQAFFPEVWDRFAESVPSKFSENPRDYHMPRVLGKDKKASKQSAYEYMLLEGSIISLDDRTKLDTFEKFDPVSTIIECHYMANQCFMPENYIMDNASKLVMPVYLIQGRYDAICPAYTALELSKVLPNAQLQWTVAGHSGNDRNNWEAVHSIVQTVS